MLHVVFRLVVLSDPDNVISCRVLQGNLGSGGSARIIFQIQKHAPALEMSHQGTEVHTLNPHDLRGCTVVP